METNKQGCTLKSLAIFCASSEGNDPVISKASTDVGKFLAAHKIRLVYGGSKRGLMGCVAAGVLEHGGKVTGVIPEFLKIKEVVHTGLDELIVTRDMHERKLKMHELSDGFIALPGGFGTFEELFEIITWAQLGLHKKPIGLLNIDGFYDDLVRMLEKMMAKGLLKKEYYDLLLVAQNMETLLEKMHSFSPLPTPKWMGRSQT